MKMIKVNTTLIFVFLLITLYFSGCTGSPPSSVPGTRQAPPTIPGPEITASHQEYVDTAGPVLLDGLGISVDAPFLANVDMLRVSGRILEPWSDVRIWLIGHDYVDVLYLKADRDGFFEFTGSPIFSYQLPPGEMYIFVQTPGPNGLFDVNFDPQSGMVSTVGLPGSNPFVQAFNMVVLSGDDTTHAADFLQNAFQDPRRSVDDLYREVRITVEEPYIRINPVGEFHVGDEIRINGTTNLRVGDELLAEILQKDGVGDIITGNVGKWSVNTGPAKVTAGNESNNVWEYRFSSGGWNSDDYVVRICSPLTSERGNAEFCLYP